MQAIWGDIWKHTTVKGQTNACDFAFIQAGNLRPHLKAHSREKPKNISNVTLHLLRPAIWKYHHYNTNSGEKPLMKTHFNCDWCGKYIISDSALREHIERYIQKESFQHIRTVIGMVTNLYFSHRFEGYDWGGLPIMISINGDDKGG